MVSSTVLINSPAIHGLQYGINHSPVIHGLQYGINQLSYSSKVSNIIQPSTLISSHFKINYSVTVTGFTFSILCKFFQKCPSFSRASTYVNLLRSPGINSQPVHRLEESIPRNRFLGSLNVYKYGLSKTLLASNGILFLLLRSSEVNTPQKLCIDPHSSHAGWGALQRQNTEISKANIPRKGISGSEYPTFMRLWAIYIFPFCWRKYVYRSWDYINHSQTHKCGNWGWEAALFPEKEYINGIL
jgi:hypothetical protein